MPKRQATDSHYSTENDSSTTFNKSKKMRTEYLSTNDMGTDDMAMDYDIGYYNGYYIDYGNDDITSETTQDLNSVVIDQFTISPSSLRNYMLNDPFQDVLSKFPEFFINKFYQSPQNLGDTSNPKLPDKRFNKFIIKQGQEFETAVLNILKTDTFNGYKFNVCDTLTQLPDDNRSDNVINSIIYNETIEAMAQGYDIIYQGCVYDKEENWIGHPDFLIKSTVFNYLSENTKYEHENEPSIFGNYHYVVVDTKFKKLSFWRNLATMENNASQKYYKVQVYIYNHCLSMMQGYEPQFAYIIGRGFNGVDENNIKIKSNNALDRLGEVNVGDFDAETRLQDTPIFDVMYDAIDWRREILFNISLDTLNAVDWKNPDETYFRPNMCFGSEYDYENGDWTPVRKEIAKQQYELTLLPSITYNHRLTAHNKGIFNITDYKCSLEAFGIKWTGKPYQNNLVSIINNCQDFQNQLPDIQIQTISNKSITDDDKKCINKLPSNRNILRHTMKYGFMSVDIEKTNDVNDVFNSLPESDSCDINYLIGVVDSRTGKYESFITNDLTTDSELVSFRQFIYYLNVNFMPSPVYVFIWSGAELQFFKALLERHLDFLTEEEIAIVNHFLKYNVDLCKIFKLENIIIKGTFNFKLKTIAKALYARNIIATNWIEELDGLDAMCKVWDLNKECSSLDIKISEHPDFSHILDYNKTDCQVLIDIVRWLQQYTKHNTSKKHLTL
jgi:hypothetical protein